MTAVEPRKPNPVRPTAIKADIGGTALGIGRGRPEAVRFDLAARLERFGKEDIALLAFRRS